MRQPQAPVGKFRWRAPIRPPGSRFFSVAFRLDAGSTAREMLASCATSANQAYVASDGQALIQAFESIGREIARLRVAG